MKVLHFLHYAQGGIVTVVLEQIRHARAGVEYHVAFLERTEHLERLVADYGVRAHYLGTSPVAAMINYRKLLASLSPDVIHLHSYMPRLLTAIAQQCGFWLGGVVSTVHNDYPHLTSRGWRKRLKRLTESVALKMLEGPIVVSNNAVRAQVAKAYRIAAAQIRTISNGVAVIAESPAVAADGAPIAAAIGRFSTQKNHSMLLDAWSVLVQRVPDAKLWLIGDGELRPLLEEKVWTLGIADSVVFWGWLSRQEAVARLAQARLLVLSSLFESLPTVAIEASLVGLPVVSTKVAGIGEIIEHGRNGFIVQHQHDLVEALATLLPDAERCRAMGQIGHERAARLFSVSRYVSELEELYRTLAPTSLVRQYSGL